MCLPNDLGHSGPTMDLNIYKYLLHFISSKSLPWFPFRQEIGAVEFVEIQKKRYLDSIIMSYPCPSVLLQSRF